MYKVTTEEPDTEYWVHPNLLVWYVDQPLEEILAYLREKNWITGENKVGKAVPRKWVLFHRDSPKEDSYLFFDKKAVFDLLREKGWVVHAEEEFDFNWRMDGIFGIFKIYEKIRLDLEKDGDQSELLAKRNLDLYKDIITDNFTRLLTNLHSESPVAKIKARLSYLGASEEVLNYFSSFLPQHVQDREELLSDTPHQSRKNHQRRL
jgi:hypothetical protein